MSDDGRRIPELAAGRRPAGRALLGWLDDVQAPLLCRVAGSAGSGRSHLLAWLVLACTSAATPAGQRVHAVLPAAGVTADSAAWLLGGQLGVVARAPADVLAAVAQDGRRTVICVPELSLAADPGALVAELLAPLLRMPGVRLVVEASEGTPEAAALTAVAAPAVLDLDDPQWTDRARYEAWCAAERADPSAYPSPGAALAAAGRQPSPPPVVERLADLLALVPGGPPELLAAGPGLLSRVWAAAAREGAPASLAADPLLLVHGDPLAVTAALAGLAAPTTVSAAWAEAGPALAGEDDPAVRAAVLRSRLLGRDDAAAARLDPPQAGWQGVWARWRTGAVAALSTGCGPYAGQLLVADPDGAVRAVLAGTGQPQGTVVVPGPKPLRALTVTPGGSVLLLDAWGAAAIVAPDRPAEGFEPYALGAALDGLRAVAGAGLTVLAAAPELPGAGPAAGDAAGGVHWSEDGRVTSRELHHGPVTALAATADGGVPLLVSGGLDGAVRLWGPDSEPMAEPSDRRHVPVTAVAAGLTAAGLAVAAAWADGLVRVRRLTGDGRALDFRPGSPVHALAFADGLLAVGLPDGLLAVRADGGAAR
ncbi:hypothetical protein [Kitasatospora sp. NPDC057223]|uniref:hypothetical protein n=1 Tax=Kitasatospora sp. NPDC057223 TaxID=3346055 RepID=UPI0036440111